MARRFAVTVAAGSLRVADAPMHLPHQWTAGGVSAEVEFTGGHLLHLATAGCVLNDLYREAATLGIRLDGARVEASGDFDEDTWASTGIQYRVSVDTAVSEDEVKFLVATVDAKAEIPRALRVGAQVRRAGSRVTVAA